MELKAQLTPKLKQLRLSGILATLEARHRQALDGQWSYVEFLERLLEDEVERRAQKQLALRLLRATLNTTKTLESFDWSFNPTVNRQQVLQLASGDYLRQKRNLLVCGPTGVGESHLAQALAHEACRQGFDVLFVSTHKMLAHLHGGRADGTWERRLAVYIRPDLLVLDDFGLRPLADLGSLRSLRRDQRALRGRQYLGDQQSCTGRMARPLRRGKSAPRLRRTGSPGTPRRDDRHYRTQLPGPGTPTPGGFGAANPGERTERR